MGRARRGGQCWNVPWTWGLNGQLRHKYPNNERCVNQSPLKSTWQFQILDRYFPKDDTPERYDWIRQPFTARRAQHLLSELEDVLLDLCAERTLQTAFSSYTLEEFWLSVAAEYPGLSKAAMDILFPFRSTYLCEKTFSTLTFIKNKYRSRLIRVEDDLRVAVSTIKLRVRLLCSLSRPSHLTECVRVS